MSFFRGLLTGAAKQYNANVAAQKAEDAEMERLRTEYGYRARVEQDKAYAESLLADEQFANDMFLQSMEAENSERLERIKGQEDRLTKALEARLDGTSARASYQVGTGDDNQPIYVGIPTPTGSSDSERIRNNMMWFDTQGPAVYQQLLDYGDAQQIADFEARAVNALDARFSLPDIRQVNRETGRITYLDKTSQYPGVVSLINSSPSIFNRVQNSLVPDLKRRINESAGLPPEFKDIELTELESGERGLSVPNPPVWMRDETGRVDMASYDQINQIQKYGQIPVEKFFMFINRAGADVESQRAKFSTWKRVDNLYAPDPGSADLTPYIDPTAKAEVAQTLSPLRHQNPALAMEYFRYVAANDYQPASAIIDPTLEGNQMTATEMKKMYNRDPEAMRGRAIASRRVVRLAGGILQASEQGGRAGLAATLQLAAAGAGDTARALAEVGGEIIGAFGSVPASNEADQRVRDEQMSFLSDVQGKLARGNTVSETAMIRYYSTLLAYSMAVAVQGGDAAARTVSDQDVQRVAAGIAPAAPGSGRALLSMQELYTITVSAQHEMREQAAIYEGYGSQDRVSTRAAYYYEQTFQDRPTNFRELLQVALQDNEGAYEALFGDTNASTVSTGVDPNSKSEAFKSRTNPGPLPGTSN